MKIEEFIKKYNSIIGLIILFLGLIIAINVYKRQNEELFSLKDRIRQWEEKEVILKDIQFLESRLGEYKEKFKKKDVSELIRELTECAVDCDVIVSSIQPGPEKSEENFVFQYITMDILSSYHNLRRLVSVLEKNPQIKIEEINLSQETEEEKTVKIRTNILINFVSFR